MKRLALLAGLLLLPALAAPASAAPQTTSATNCFESDLVLCVTATLTLELSCHRIDPGHVSCDAPLSWTTSGVSQVHLPGAVQHAASASLEWCRPGAFCQSYGVAFRIDACSWLAPENGCASTDTFNLGPGPIPYDGTGGCMSLDLSGFAEADGYLLAYFGRSVVSATTTNDISTTFCG